MDAVTACPLCGQPVSRMERQAGLYACLTVCIPLIPFPQHLIEKHPDYLTEAKNEARPVFYTFVFSLAAAAALLLTDFLTAAALPGSASVVAVLVGFRKRKNLLRRFSRRVFP